MHRGRREAVAARMIDTAPHPWNQGLWERLQGQGDRSSHAWLFCGIEGLGKNALAVRYLVSVLDATGRARTLIPAGSHPDLHVLMPGALLGGDGLIQRYALRYLDEPKSAAAKPKKAISVVRVAENTGSAMRVAARSAATGGGSP